MNLIDNELDVKKEKNTKIIKIIIISMLILFIIGGSLLGYLSYLQSKQFKFFINGKTQNFSADLFYFDDDGEIYVSIKDLVNVLKNNSVNYEINNGVYKEYDEDITKNYIKSVDEVAGYEANSQKMYKVVITDNVYEYFNLVLSFYRQTKLPLKKEEMKKLDKKLNYMTVPAAIKELEKIEMVRQLDNIYRLDHAVTANQKVILKAFGLDANSIKYFASELSKELKKSE